ncbi:MAG: TadE family protein [Planctomycetaceae bacterium]
MMSLSNSPALFAHGAPASLPRERRASLPRERRASLPRERGENARRGATLVETAIVLGGFLLVLFAMLELGLVAMKHNSLAEAARTVAREAVVRGEKAPPRRAAWGPAEYEGTAADASEIAETLRSILVAMPHDEVDLHVEWPDGENTLGKRVRVTVAHRHASVLPFLFGNGEYALSATSMMRIAH